MTQRTCPECGKEYTPKHKTSIFCSQTCAMKARHKRAPSTECPICGTKTKGSLNKLYCSPECRAEARRRRNAEVEAVKQRDRPPRFGFWGI